MKPNRFAWSGDDVLGIKIVNDDPRPELKEKEKEKEKEEEDGEVAPKPESNVAVRVVA